MCMLTFMSLNTPIMRAMTLCLLTCSKSSKKTKRWKQIIEGPQMDNLKIDSIVQEDTMQNVTLMLVKMEVTSIEDFKV